MDSCVYADSNAIYYTVTNTANLCSRDMFLLVRVASLSNAYCTVGPSLSAYLLSQLSV